MRRSRDVSDPRLPSMSKIPPHFSETLGAAGQRATSLSNCVCHYRRILEDSLACAEDVVERVLKVRRGAGEIRADLCYILFVALLDFFTEQLLERAALQTFGMFRGIIGDHVGHECTSQPLGAKTRITREEWIDRTPLAWRRRTGWTAGH